jgi:hypothetical protein
MSSMLFRAHRYAADSPELKGMPIQPRKWNKLNAEMGLNLAAVKARR